MSEKIIDNIICLNNKTQPIKILYEKNYHGFSDSNNDILQYLFELIIQTKFGDIKYFRNLEDNKYSNLIKLEHKIKLNDIKSYKASLSLIPSKNSDICELEGDINQNESSSTNNKNNLYIEFTKNNSGYTLCSCFYTGMDQYQIFASPPN
jgi:hypothetical protein